MGILAGQFDEDSFHVLPPIHDLEESLADNTVAWFQASSPSFAVVHADPASQGVIGLIESLAKKMGDVPSGISDSGLGGGFSDGFLVGGMTASQGQGYQIADKLNGNGISGIVFSPQVGLVTGLSQGCQQLGDVHLVTQVVDNVIMRLDDEPALDVLKKHVGELLARDLARLPGYVHGAIPVPGTDTGEFMVRNILGIDTDRGWIAIADRTLESGDQLGFVRSDPVRARANMDRMLDDIKLRIPSQPLGGLYFSCVSRGPLLFGTSGEEARIIRAALGPVPIVGFYGNGEIFNSRLHQYSSVLVLFY
jgi:small ligand-binding sensory domain FIST